VENEGAEIGHLNATSEITLEIVKAKAIKGVAVLTGRTFLLSLLSLAATALLTVFLSPSEFGVFWIVSAIVNFLAYFSDVGLAAALIQKKEKVEEEELRTTFTIQQFLVIMLLIILFALTPYLQGYYKFSIDAKFLLYALGLSLLFSSLKTIPSILLERELDFPKLVVPQVLENLVYNSVAVYFAWKGMGIASFTYAVLARGIVGLIAIYLLKPWLPGISLDRKALKKLLYFGVPYQANTLLATIKDDGMTALLGGILGSAGIGLLGWAQKWAYMPLRLFMDHVLKVTFPAFSRMQEDKVELQKSITKSIFFVCFLVFPTTLGLILMAPILMKIIPRYEKWNPAYLPLIFISVNTITAPISSQLTNLLNATGKIKVTFKLMVMWTFLTWLFVPILSIKFGINGAAFGYGLVGLSSFIAIYIVHRYIKFSFYRSVIIPLVATFVMSIVLYIVRINLPVNLSTVWVLITLGFIVYMGMMYLLVGSSIFTDIKRGLKAIFKKD